MKHIYLTGMMGSGKSVTAKLLSSRNRLPLYDIDGLIVKREKKEIQKIFDEEGEAYFRRSESDVLQNVSQEPAGIVATGGGIVVESMNRRIMKETGTVVYLKADVETLWNHVQRSQSRPLLKKEDPKQVIKDLLEKRSSFYEEADIIYDIQNQTPGQVTQGLESKIKLKEKE